MPLGDWVQYIRDDPLRVLYVIGGSGGIVFWFDRIWNRRKLYAVVIEDEPAAEGLWFEVTNVGAAPTALMREIRVKARDPHGRRLRLVYDMQTSARHLPPLLPTKFRAVARSAPPHGWGQWEHSWFRKYQFRPVRGSAANVRVRSASLVSVGTVRFWFELVRFLVWKRISSDSPRTITEYLTRQRARGAKDKAEE